MIADLTADPLESLIANCVEQIAQEYDDLLGDNLENVELIRAGVMRGLHLRNAKIADLL